jgi:hypothetical protein
MTIKHAVCFQGFGTIQTATQSNQIRFKIANSDCINLGQKKE